MARALRVDSAQSHVQCWPRARRFPLAVDSTEHSVKALSSRFQFTV